METEDVANDITAELARNREKIESSRAKVRLILVISKIFIFVGQASEFAGITDSARRVLASMSRRDVRQKYLVFFIAVVLIIAIVITAVYTSK